MARDSDRRKALLVCVSFWHLTPVASAPFMHLCSAGVGLGKNVAFDRCGTTFVETHTQKQETEPRKKLARNEKAPGDVPVFAAGEVSISDQKLTISKDRLDTNFTASDKWVQELRAVLASKELPEKPTGTVTGFLENASWAHVVERDFSWNQNWLPLPEHELLYLRVISIISYFALGCYMALLIHEFLCMGGGNRERTSEPMHGVARDLVRRILAFGVSAADMSVSAMRSCLHSIRSSGKKSGANEVADLARVHVEELRIEINRSCALCLVDLLVPLLAFLAFMGAHDGVWRAMDGGLVLLYMQQWDFVGILYTFIACLLAVMFPKFITASTMSLFYLLNMLRILLSSFVIQDCTILVTVFPINGLSMLLSSLVCGDVWLTTTVNGIAICWQCCEYVRMAETQVGPFPRHSATYIVQQLLLVCATAFCCVLAQWALTEYVRIQTALTAYARNESVVHGLLSVVCDAVVHLGPGPDFQIMTPAPQLAKMIQMPAGDPSLEGQSFLDIVAQQDVPRFQEFQEKQNESVQGMNLALRNTAGGAVVDVRLYGSSFQDPDGRHGHIIGLCEQLGDTVAAAAMPASSSLGDMRRSSQSPSASSASGSAGDIVPPWTRTGRRRSGDATPEIAVLVDAGTPQLEILHFTPEFAFVIAERPSEKDGFLKWVVNWKQHLTEVQGFVNATSSALPNADARMTLTLRPPLAAGLGFELEAECILRMEGPGGSSSGGGNGSENMSGSGSGSQYESPPAEAPINLKISLRKVRRKRVLPVAISGYSRQPSEPSVTSGDAAAGSAPRDIIAQALPPSAASA